MSKKGINKDKKNGQYKHGKYCKTYKTYCIDCDTVLCRPDAKRCRACYVNKIMKVTGKSPRYKNGLPKCIDCKKQLNRYASKRCKICAGKINGLKKLGNKNPSYIHGQSYAPYSIEFTQSLKNEIRIRDNHQCQICGITEEEHIIIIGRALSIHHIDYNKENCDKDNLITLCNQCNTRVNYNRKYWIKYFKRQIKQEELICQKN